MSDKPEALRLADALEQGKFLLSVERDATAAELRRLHAEIEEWRTKAAAWLASPEAAQRLEGYRELGRLAEKAETQRDELRAVLAAAETLSEQAEEYEFDDGLGRGAVQIYWDELENAIAKATGDG